MTKRRRSTWRTGVARLSRAEAGRTAGAGDSIQSAQGSAPADSAPAGRKDFALYAVMLAVGAALRLCFPADVEFKPDEARALLLGRDWLANPCVASVGMPSSVGIPNPPATVYLFAALYAQSGGDPERASIGVMLWNVFGLIVAAAWLGRRRLLGRFWGVWALGFVCVNPWAVILSRKVWAQDLMLPFVALALWGIDAVWARTWRWGRVAVGLAAAAMVTQIHLSGFFWLAAFALGAAIFWPRERLRRAAPTAGLLALCLLLLSLPWLMGMARNGLYSGPRTTPLAGPGDRAKALVAVAATWLGQGYPALRGPLGPQTRFLTFMGPAWAGLDVLATVVMGIVFAVGAVALARMAWLRTRRDSALASGVAPFGFLLSLFFVPTEISAHYGSALILPGAVTLALALRAIESRGRGGGVWRRLLRLSGIAFLAVRLWTSVGFLLYIHAQGGEEGEYGPALRLKRGAIESSKPGEGYRLPEEASLEFQYLMEQQEMNR